MKHNNIVRLNESQLHNLISECVTEIMNEGRFKNGLKNLGKGMLYTTIAAGLGAAALKGCDNQYEYERSLNQQAKEMSGGWSEGDIQQWLDDRGLENTKENRSRAIMYFQDLQNEYWDEQQTNESKRLRKPYLSEARLNRIINRTMRKVLS